MRKVTVENGGGESLDILLEGLSPEEARALLAALVEARSGAVFWRDRYSAYSKRDKPPWKERNAAKSEAMAAEVALFEEVIKGIEAAAKQRQ